MNNQNIDPIIDPIMDPNLITGLVKADRMDLYKTLVNCHAEMVAAQARANALFDRAEARINEISAEAFFATEHPGMSKVEKIEYDNACHAQSIAIGRYNDAARAAYKAIRA